LDIKRGPQNLEALLATKKISIPSFQRNFVWKTENVKQMLLDLIDASTRNETHFFGPIILRSPGTEAAVTEYEVIDGQQRITTSVMILSVLRDIAQDAKYFKPKNTEIVNAINQYMTAPGLGAGSRFKAAPLIREFFDAAVVANPHTQKITNSRGAMTPQEYADTKWVRKGSLFIDEFIRSKMNELDPAEYTNFVHGLTRAVTQSFQIHSMVVEDETDAYRLFESMNYLGMKLDPGDLLKSLILRRIQENAPSDLNAAVDKWDDMWTSLSGFSISKFLRHYLLSTETGKVQASKIYPLLKERVMKSPTGAKTLLHELEVNAKRYGGLLGVTGTTLGDAWLDKAAMRMNLISDTHRLLLLAILAHTPELPWRKQAFRAAEYTVFRRVAARENAQETEDMYQAMAKEFKSVTNQDQLNAWCSKLAGGLLTDQQLKTLQINNCTFEGIQYDPREDLARYANAVYETECGAGWAESPTLEHLAPQKPNADSGWKAAGCVGSVENPYEVQIHWWGNLTSLEQPLNSSVGNSEWTKKVQGEQADHSDGLRRSGFEATKQVCKVTKWDESAIHSRGEWLLESLLTLRSSDWITTGNSKNTTVGPWK
jgi:hypothetical protein